MKGSLWRSTVKFSFHILPIEYLRPTTLVIKVVRIIYLSLRFSEREIAQYGKNEWMIDG